MKFYFFNQTNSGGSFDVDNKVCHRVIIEASDDAEAIDIAENIGIYFDGCENGYDCSCCGDRWSRPWSDDYKEFPYTFGSFDETEVEKIVEKYNCKKVKKSKPFGKKDYDVIFETVEQFAQYLVDDYAWTRPDTRIYYKNGGIKEIYKSNI